MIKIFDVPRYYDIFHQVGTYKSKPIYIGPHPTVDWVAMATGKNEGVCINKKAYYALQRSPRFHDFLEAICEHELTLGAVHDEPIVRPQRELDVLDYLKSEGII